MSENVDWRLRLKEMHKANPQDDSLELGESWNEMPRPTEAGGNRTTGLYRRSVMPHLSVKNLYNIIIEKQPTANNNSKNTNSNEASSAPKALLPTIAAIESITPEEFDTINFSKYLQSKDNGTSTPFPPRRQNIIDTSPKRSSPEFRKQAADSPNRNHLQVRSLIPISTTPRTSRKSNDHNDRCSTSQKQRSIRHSKSSSPVVSSTVDTNENENVQIVSPNSQREVSGARQTVENANDVLSDKDRQENDPDEALFRRPEIVQRPSQKQNKLEKVNDIDIEPASEQSQPSSQPNNSRRNKKPERKIDALLESYKKVGESISNRTNSTQSQNFSSSTSSRRKLYKKGDSCTEDQIEDENQRTCETNVLSSNKHAAASATSIRPSGSQGSIRLGATEVDQNDDISTRSEKRTTESQRAEILNKTRSLQQNVDNGNDPQIHSHTNSHTNKLQNQHAHSGIQINDFEKNDSGSDSIDQSTKQKSVKQVLENILDDWSDSSTIDSCKQDENEGDCSDSNDFEPPINVNSKKQPSKESTVRPVRSKNEKINVSPVTQPESRLGRSKEQQVDLNDQANDSEEDEILINEDEVPPSTKTQSRQIGSKKQRFNAKIVPENNSAEADDEKNNGELVVPPSKKPQSRSKKQHLIAQKVQANDSEDEILINKNDVPTSKNSQSRPVRTKKQHIKTKNVREIDSEEDDIAMIENEDIVVSASKKSGRKQHINTKNVEANDSEEEISTSEDEVPPLKKKENIKTKNVLENGSALPSKKSGRQRGNQISTKNVQAIDSEDDELINENDLPPSKKIRGRSVRSKNQHINTKNVRDSEEDDDGQINENNEEVAVLPSKKPEKRQGRAKRQNINTKNAPEEEDDGSRNEDRGPPARKPVNRHNPPNKQRTNKARENNSEEDGKLPINRNGEIEDVSSLKRTRFKNLKDVVVVPPSKGRPNKQRIIEHIIEQVVEESDSEREDDLITSSIHFDSSQMHNNDSNSEKASKAVRVIAKKNSSNKSKADPIQLSDIEDNASNESEERQAAKKSKGKYVRSKNKRVNKNQQPKKPQANKRHLDIEDGPSDTQSNAKKKRLIVEEVSEADVFDQLKNGIDPIDDNTGESRNRNQLSKNPKQSRSRKRQLSTEERSETESTSQPNEQSDQLSEGSGSKAAVTGKPKRKKSKWEVVGTNTQYFPLKEREAAPGTRHSTRVKRLPVDNIILFPPKAHATRIALQKTAKRNPAPKRSRNENVETVYSMLLKELNESVPPLVTNFQGIEIANGFHTTIKGNMTIHHIPGENSPAYGYFTLEPGAAKPRCRLSMKLHMHIVSGPVILIINAETEELITGSFTSLPAGTQYALRNDGENQAVLFFHQHQPRYPDDISEIADNENMSKNSTETSENAN